MDNLKMALPTKLRRSLSISIPLFTALLFFGVIENIFEVSTSTNIAQTGLTVGFIFGILNLWLTWLAWKHLVP